MSQLAVSHFFPPTFLHEKLQQKKLTCCVTTTTARISITEGMRERGKKEDNFYFSSNGEMTLSKKREKKSPACALSSHQREKCAPSHSRGGRNEEDGGHWKGSTLFFLSGLCHNSIFKPKKEWPFPLRYCQIVSPIIIIENIIYFRLFYTHATVVLQERKGERREHEHDFPNYSPGAAAERTRVKKETFTCVCIHCKTVCSWVDFSVT